MASPQPEPDRPADAAPRTQTEADPDAQAATAADDLPMTDAPDLAASSASGQQSTTPAAAASGPNAAAAAAPSSSVLPKMSDPNPPPGQGAVESQPMSKSNSAGSNPAAKDAAASTASPYGTRSRNRTGASRPNYAEDKDLDMEIFEMYPERRDDDGRKPSRQGSAAVGVPQETGGTPRVVSNGSGRKPLPSDSKHVSSQHNAKEHPQPQQHQHPPSSGAATPNPPANGAPPQPSKKRKAAPAHPAGGGAQAAATPANPSLAVASRRNGGAGGGSRGYAPSNMLTFDGCKARPKDGKMVADDGTVLKVNGKQPAAPPGRRPPR